jgi:hypothetical protein
MHSNLKTFNTIRLYKSWTIFLWFLLIFLFFLIQIQIWILGPVPTAGYRYRTPAVGAVTAVSRAVTKDKKNPGMETMRRRRHILPASRGWVYVVCEEVVEGRNLIFVILQVDQLWHWHGFLQLLFFLRYDFWSLILHH